MPYDCSRNAMMDRAATRLSQQADDRRLRERFAALERRIAVLEEWQKNVKETDV